MYTTSQKVIYSIYNGFKLVQVRDRILISVAAHELYGTNVKPSMESSELPCRIGAHGRAMVRQRYRKYTGPKLVYGHMRFSSYQILDRLQQVIGRTSFEWRSLPALFMDEWAHQSAPLAVGTYLVQASQSYDS